MQMSQASSTREWLERNSSSGGGWLRERNAHVRKKKKKSDLRCLNPNEPFGLGSIFNQVSQPKSRRDSE